MRHIFSETMTGSRPIAKIRANFRAPGSDALRIPKRRVTRLLLRGLRSCGSQATRLANRHCQQTVQQPQVTDLRSFPGKRPAACNVKGITASATAHRAGLTSPWSLSDAVGSGPTTQRNAAPKRSLLQTTGDQFHQSKLEQSDRVVCRHKPSTWPATDVFERPHFRRLQFAYRIGNIAHFVTLSLKHCKYGTHANCYATFVPSA